MLLFWIGLVSGAAVMLVALAAWELVVTTRHPRPPWTLTKALDDEDDLR